MSHHTATIAWQRRDPDFRRGRYSRAHTWSFDGGVTVSASASPAVVPLPYADPAGVDPEEALVAAIASCHMLSFLHVARRAGFVVDSYTDTAIGELTPNAEGNPWLSRVTLHPRIVFSGDLQPRPADLDHLHQEAHHQCYIANSVRTNIQVAPPA